MTFATNIFKLFDMDKSSTINNSVKAALAGNWAEAIKLNLELLKMDAKDSEAMNRLAQAYKSSGNIKKALQTYQKTLSIDRFNTIANRNIIALKNYHVRGNVIAEPPPNTAICLEEPGKTKLVSLVNIAPASKILNVSPMQRLQLEIKRKSIFITDSGKTYLGALPDDLSFRLIRFIQAGYKYECFAKSVEKNCIIILVREYERSKRLNNQPTFPLGTNEHDYIIVNAPSEIPSDTHRPKEAGNEEPEEETPEPDDD